MYRMPAKKIPKAIAAAPAPAPAPAPAMPVSVVGAAPLIPLPDVAAEGSTPATASLPTAAEEKKR